MLEFNRPSNGLGETGDNPRFCIAHITEAPLGGVASCIQEIIAVHAASPEITNIFALVPEINASILLRNKAENVIVHTFKHSRGSIVALLRLAIATCRLVKEQRPNIVHVHSTIAGAVVRLCLLATRSRPKIVYTPHCWAFYLPNGNIARYLTKKLELVLSYATHRIIAVSEFEKHAGVAIGIDENKIAVIPNGIDYATHSNKFERPRSATKRLKVLFVGRFDHQKGFDIYLETMRRLEDVVDGTAVGGFIVDRPMKISIPQNVTIVAWRSRDELLELYEAADLLFMPSRSESSPLVAMEAMRASLPVFASRVGGLPEIVVDGVTGMLFELDDVDKVVECVQSISHSTLQELGRAGRLHFETNFTARKMSETLLMHYQQLIAQTPQPGTRPPHINRLHTTHA